MATPRTDVSIDTSQPLDQLLHQILNYALVAIGAEAGSIMLVANKERILQIKARLGLPRPNRREEPVYRLDSSSIAGWVALNKKPYICGDVESDRHFMRSRSGKNFTSLLSVPVVHEGKVVAVINADAAVPGRFSDRERDILVTVAAHAAAPIAEKISILDAIAEIGIEFTRLPRQEGVQRVLQLIADMAVRSLGADVVTLYQYVQSTDEFPVEGTGPTIAGVIKSPGPMRRKVYAGDISWTMVKNRKAGFYPDVHAEDFLARPATRPEGAPRDRFIDREDIQSMAALLLPYRAESIPSEEIVGVMFVNYRKPHQFNIDERSALASLADYAAATILGARHEEKHRIERVKLVESISAHLAHRMSNFAGPSRLIAQELREYIPLSDTRRQDQLSTIERQASLLLGLSNVLAQRLRDSGSLTRFDDVSIEAELHEAVSDLGIDVSGVNLVCRLPPALPRVRSDQFLIRQVLRDLIRNAAEAVSGQETARIDIMARVDDSARRVVVDITDTGPGVKPKLIDKLFAPGVSSKPDHLGIGLWSCRTFVRATGGDLALTRTGPAGTTFSVYLPTVAEGIETRSMTPAPSQDADVLIVDGPETNQQEVAWQREPSQDADVLIMDDNPDWLAALSAIVTSAHLSLRTASTYEQAAYNLRRYHYKFAILDFSLDDSFGREGLALLDELEERRVGTSVILITAYGTPDIEARADWG
jgi:signal transduction histidine kinase